MLLGVELVAEGHELVDFFGDSVLLGERREWERVTFKIILWNTFLPFLPSYPTTLNRLQLTDHKRKGFSDNLLYNSPHYM